MNRAQQRQLIQAQVAEIDQTDDLKVLEHDNEFQLHLDIAAHSGQRYHVMLNLEDYDVEPPGLYILDESGKITWDRATLPPPPFVNGTKHPLEERDFFCIPGTYDYHSHPLHEHEAWDALRNSTPLAALVRKLADTLKNPPIKQLRLQINNLHKVPLKHVTLILDNGEATRIEVNDSTTVALRGIEIALANNQSIRIEAQDAT